MSSKARFKEVSERLAELSSKFNDNLLDATNAFELIIEDRAQLSGMPDDVLEAAQQAAAELSKAGWKFTLHMPSYLPVMQYADNRALRERMYRAYATRAAEFGNPEWDNTALISEILKLRREQAHLLGFETFAELSLEPKMADTPEQVLGFLEELATRAKPHAERDLAELKEFAAKQLGIAELQPWDVAYGIGKAARSHATRFRIRR